MRLFTFILSGLMLFVISSKAQTPVYPKDYFRNPVGIPMQIQANLGELRPNHWHMGLDIRTNAKENLPVYAAASGYIAAIGIRPSSFGRFIIINHPNGLSTLYAHLNDFYPALENAVRAKQAANESWPLEWKPAPNQFKVSKGDFIAYSGNTGGSQGPHLHFEIFDTKSEKRLNPLMFGFPLIDNQPPALFKLAMYDRSKSTYSQNPVIFTLKKTDSGYIIPKTPIIKTGLAKVSFAIEAVDRMNSSGSDDGIYSAMISVDSILQVKFRLDSVSYEDTRYMNAQIDYKLRYNGGIWLQHLSRLPGDFGGIYQELNGDGVIRLSDTLVHFISIDVKDTYGNAAVLNFAIQHYDSLATQNYYSGEPVFVPGRLNEFKKPSFEALLPTACIYDTIPVSYFSTASSAYNSVSDIFSIGNAAYPVQDPITIRIKPNKEIPAAQRDKIVMVRTDKKKTTAKKANWDNGWLIAQFSDFGSYQAIVDMTAPNLSAPGNGDTINLSKSSIMAFTPTDNYGIESFKALLYSCASDSTGYHCSNDSLSEKKWLRFTNDKGRTWIYRFDENFPFGVHLLQVTVEDIVGNATTKKWWVKRFPYTPPPPKKKAAHQSKSKEKKSKGESGKQKSSIKKKETGTKKTTTATKKAVQKPASKKKK